MEPSHLVSAAFPALRTVLVNRKRGASLTWLAFAKAAAGNDAE